jgi:hypothetical protein
MTLCWLVVVGAGALQAWDVHWALDPDGVAYLDMGQAFLQGNWRLALNALWPPLYPALIGLTDWLLQPPARLAIPVLHALNLAIYLAAYGTFLLLLRELVQLQHQAAARRQAQPALSDTAWLLLGTAIFVWAALTLATIPEETPDMLAGVFIFASFACLLRIQRGQASLWTYGLLGGALALAYLSKYFMFGMALVFLAVAVAAAWLASRSWRGTAGHALLALGAFALVSAPFVIGLSWLKGHLLFNNSGTIAYLYHVDKVPFVNWQGGPAGTGTLLHPTHEIDQAPAIFAYASPVSGTYPPWDDPDYWMAGGTAHFDIGGQLDILLKEAAPTYTQMFVVSGAALLVTCLLLYALAGSLRQSLKTLAGQWVLLIPTLTALALFALVHVENRYAVAFAATLWLGLLGGVQLPVSTTLRPLIGRLALGAAVVTTLVGALPPAVGTLDTLREWARGRNPQAPDQWQVASALEAKGIPQHDRIAVMGLASHDTAWAYLAHEQIVAEIPQDQENEYWSLDSTQASQVSTLLAGTGADWLVTEFVPVSAAGRWQRLGQTDYYALKLGQP